MENYFGYIYKFTDLINNKIYIGKRQQPQFDTSYYGSGKKWVEMVKEIGKENVKREILQWCKTRRELFDAEVYWINCLHSQDPDIGYNIHRGGAGGNSLGDTEAWSNLHKGSRNGRYHKEVSKETIEKISNANKGKVRTDEFKDRVSKMQKGRKKPEGFGDKISKAQKGRKKSDIELQHLREKNKITALKNTGKHIYNNGEREIRLYPDEPIPDGFTKGRLPKMHYNMNNLPKNYHWYNNGKIAVYCEQCPEGFIQGRKLDENKEH